MRDLWKRAQESRGTSSVDLDVRRGGEPKTLTVSWPR